MHSCAMFIRSRSPSNSSHSLPAEKCVWASAKLVYSVSLVIAADYGESSIVVQ